MLGPDPYSWIEGAIADQLRRDGSPFRSVGTRGGEMSDPELAAELESLRSLAPAALVFYSEGRGSRTAAGELEETATITVLVVSAGRSREGATHGEGEGGAEGLYPLTKWVIDALNGFRGTGVPNDLTFVQTRRYVMANQPLGVAAMAILFETLICHD